MKYRVMCSLTFDIEDEARDFYHDIKLVIPKASPQPDDFAHYHACTHVDELEGPCEVIEECHP